MPIAAKQVGWWLGALVIVATGCFSMRDRPTKTASLPTAPITAPQDPDLSRFRGDVNREREAQARSGGVVTAPSAFAPPMAAATAPCEPIFSPDGRYVACRQPFPTRREPSGLYIFDTKTGGQLTRQQTSEDVSVELFWPTSDRLVMAGVWAAMWKANQGHAVFEQLFRAPENIAMPVDDTNLSKGMKITDKAKVLVTNVAPQYGLGVRMISDHREASEGTRFVEIFTLKTEARKVLFQPEDYSPADVSPFLWSPTGKARLLVSEFAGDYELQTSLWDANTGKRLWKTSFDGYNVHLDWTPDGRYIVASRVTGSKGRDPFPQHVTMLVDARDGHIARKWKSQNSVMSSAVSNDTVISYGYEKKPGQNFYSRSWALTDLQTGQRTMTCWAKSAPPRLDDLALSADSGMVAGTSTSGMMLWKMDALRKGDDKPQLLSAALGVVG